jgi:hypothetical protein
LGFRHQQQRARLCGRSEQGGEELCCGAGFAARQRRLGAKEPRLAAVRVFFRKGIERRPAVSSEEFFESFCNRTLGRERKSRRKDFPGLLCF